ncbi:MAG TPA: GntR family transcriptional regulator [Micromonospora sp.]|nr:GntR family transcriptional regulator [Micromonospora sp.]
MRRRRRYNYREIAHDLAHRIILGEHRPGTQIPSYTELSDLYEVSYRTAARAVAVVRDEWGMVYGEQGRGVFVEDRRYWRYPHA